MTYHRTIARIFDNLVPILHLEGWDIQVFANGEEALPDSDWEGIAAKIKVRDDYMRANVYLGKPMKDYYKKGQNHAIMRAMLHELCHIFIDPVFRLGTGAHTASSIDTYNDIRERQTSMIEHALTPLIPDSVWSIKNEKSRNSAKSRGTTRGARKRKRS